MKVFDLHCDTLSELRYAEEAGQPKSFAENDLQIDLKKLQKGDYMLQCFAAFVNLARPGQDPLVAALEEIDIFKRIMAKYSDFIAPVYQPEDLRKNAEAGKISGMLTIEEGGCCKGSLGVLRLMHELGVRMMTLTWNHENELASPNVVPGADTDTIWPCQPNTKTGLKEKGFEFLAEMERLHIIADVSHLSDKGFWDIAEHSTRPFAASHSNCRALAPHCRNLTDEMIRAMAERGGLVGLNYCSGFLDNQPEESLCRSTVALMAKHAAHFKKVGGIEILGLGSDFDGIGGELETINILYVTDPTRHLLGVLSVRDLLLAEEDDLIQDIMDPNVVSVNTMDDKEDVAQALSKYDFLAMPVVDKEQRLVGIVTVDDAMDVIEEETTEDFEKMAAMLPSDKPYLKSGIFATWRARLPWLMVLMLSATFTGMILNHYESALAACLVLNSYIPMLSGTGGNSGTQASVAVIRALSLDEVDFSDIFQVLWKELRVSLLCGVCLAGANFVKMQLVDRLLLGNAAVTPMVCLVVCLTILFVVVFAKCVGCSLPILAEKIGLDPAVMASPFISTIVDATSLLIYFRFASWFLL